jgi:hypothetical protein
MENIHELQKQAGEASLNRVATHTVGIVNSIRTKGYDPLTKRRGDGEEVGTGCAGRWGPYHFVLTAEHVIKPEAQPSDLRIFWRDIGTIERRSDADLTENDIVDGTPIRDPNATIHRCKWEDLAVISIDPAEAGTNAEFADLAANWVDPAEGEIVNVCGFPLDRNLVVGKYTTANKEERTLALRPEIFSGQVLPCPTEQERRFQTTSYDPDRHYLVPYEHPTSRHPRGFSGAAAWWESDAKKLVWRANFKFAGICTSCYKNGTVEQVVKASVVRRFLTEVFGPA